MVCDALRRDLRDDAWRWEGKRSSGPSAEPPQPRNCKTAVQGSTNLNPWEHNQREPSGIPRWT